jgi:hypothetical protein
MKVCGNAYEDVVEAKYTTNCLVDLTLGFDYHVNDEIVMNQRETKLMTLISNHLLLRNCKMSMIVFK